MKQKISFLLSLNIWLCTAIFGQLETYNFKRAIEGIDNQWHQIILPETMYEKVKSNFSDIRIYGITPENDTIEVPYLLKIATSKREIENVNF